MDLTEEKTAATDAFWAAYCAATGTSGDYDVLAFGDSPAMADELADLVLWGPKRATAGLREDYPDAADLPGPGDHAIVLDGRGDPVAIIRTTDIRVGPLGSVTADFAWDEGEGDRSRDMWLDMHRAFFTRVGAARGFADLDRLETVFERFELVWPQVFQAKSK